LEINVIKSNLTEIECDGIIIGLFSDMEKLPDAVKDFDKDIKGKIEYYFQEKEITGKYKELTIIHTLNEIKAKRVIITGIGSTKNFETNQIREAFSSAVKKLRNINCKKIAIVPPEIGFIDNELLSEAISEGILIGLYRFTKYITENKDQPEIEHMIFAIPPSYNLSVDTMKKGISYAELICKNVNIVKDICNEPSNHMTPEIFADQAVKIFQGSNIKCTILDEKKIKEENMNLLMAVGQASKTPPRLVVLEYIKDKSLPTVGPVGKGITFDTGGIMLKQTKNTLFEMKRDLTGGSIALGAIKTLYEMDFPVNVVSVIPLAENAIGNNAYKPGDIFTSMSGKTMEIFDTDCEGRLILADAFTYIQKYHNPKILIDLGTLLNLTNVIGDDKIPFFANSTSLIPQLEKAAEKSGEEVWYFPTSHKYKERIMSRFADRKNRSYKNPQFLTLGLFLEDFINKGVDWVHLDLAGVDTKYGDSSYVTRGSTAMGLRLLIRFLYEIKDNYLPGK